MTERKSKIEEEGIDINDFHKEVFHRDTYIYNDLAELSKSIDYSSDEIAKKIGIEKKYIEYLLETWMKNPHSHMDIGKFVKLKNGKWKFLKLGDKYFRSSIKDIQDTYQ